MVHDSDSNSISSEFTWHKTKVCQKMSLALFIRQNRKKTLPFKNNSIHIHVHKAVCMYRVWGNWREIKQVEAEAHAQVCRSQLCTLRSTLDL